MSARGLDGASQNFSHWLKFLMMQWLDIELIEKATIQIEKYIAEDIFFRFDGF